jgi:hydroxyacylglutathione hydrolase
MTSIEIFQFPCLSDNYGVLIHDPETQATASIDAPDASAVRAALSEKNWSLSHILTTHHHHDHTGGNLELKQATHCTIVGPKAEAGKIPGIDIQLSQGDSYTFGSTSLQVFETPGHTLGQINYWFEEQNLLFSGDTLFTLGCGRVFEGTMDQMWSSLQKLMALPGGTIIYSGHEYTLANAAFALSIEPGNAALRARAELIKEMRAHNQPTVPTTMRLELETNPFLRPDSAEIQEHLGMTGADLAQVFAEIRRRKDSF